MTKALTITIGVEGDITGVELNASPEVIYEKIFNAAKRRAKSHPSDFENGIKAVVFGAFLLEALCNNRFKTLLFRVVTNEKHAAPIWNVVRRISVYDKLTIAFKIAEADPVKIKDNLKRITGIFDLRNRLAHFKDNGSLLVDTLRAEELEGFLDSVLEPELVQLLTGDNLEAKILDVTMLTEWIDEVFGVEPDSATTQSTSDRD